jgi:transcriptional regulator with XRE-family HTH domain
VSRKKSETPGGNRLRLMRETRRKSQLEVELDAHLGIGYLQRVESGKVQRPERETLERILGVLDARYTERRDILEMFGYVVDAPLPNDAEIEWAVGVYQAELSDVPFPAYLLDCGHRLLVWNRLAPTLFAFERRTPDDAPLHRASMIHMIFDTAYPVRLKVANPDVFYPAQMRALRYEMRLFHGEPWYHLLIEELRRSALFEQYWLKAEAEADYHIPARPLVPIELKASDARRLQFRLFSEPFAQDRRFRVIYFVPADAETTQQCVAWLQSDNALS